MAKAPSSTRIYFRREHVIVKFPGHAGKIQVLRPSLLGHDPMPAVTGGFNPTRPVIDLKLVDTTLPESRMYQFDPPIEVRIRYTKDDPIDTEGLPHLAYWDGSTWVRFDASHNFRVEGWDKAKERGWAVVDLKEWGDPPIAVGT